MGFRLSPSSISLMNDCSRCFWLDKHGKWKRPAGIFPSLPSGMDSVLKKHFNKFRDKGLLPPELCDNNNCSDMKLFGSNNEEKELLKSWQNNLQGIRWTDSSGNILAGAVDNILVNKKDGKLIVLDYKTKGFKLREDSHKYYKNQMDFYNFLLRKNGYKTEDYSFLLFYVPDSVTETGEVIFDTTLIKMDVDVKNAENIFNKAIELLEGKCPSDRCDWCRFVMF